VSIADSIAAYPASSAGVRSEVKTTAVYGGTGVAAMLARSAWHGPRCRRRGAAPPRRRARLKRLRAAHGDEPLTSTR